MKNKAIIIHLGLDEAFRAAFSGECSELVKILANKDILIRQVYNYLMDPSADKLNPKKYTESQREFVNFVKEHYEYILKYVPQSLSFIYKTEDGTKGFMKFDKKLLQYQDAFHKFGNLEEHIYLTATQADISLHVKEYL